MGCYLRCSPPGPAGPPHSPHSRRRAVPAPSWQGCPGGVLWVQLGVRNCSASDPSIPAAVWPAATCMRTHTFSHCQTHPNYVPLAPTSHIPWDVLVRPTRRLRIAPTIEKTCCLEQKMLRFFFGFSGNHFSICLETQSGQILVENDHKWSSVFRRPLVVEKGCFLTTSCQTRVDFDHKWSK